MRYLPLKRSETENRIFVRGKAPSGGARTENMPSEEMREAVFGTPSGSTYYSVFRNEIDKKNGGSGSERAAILRSAAAVTLSLSVLLATAFIAVTVIKDSSVKSRFRNTILGISGMSGSDGGDGEDGSGMEPEAIPRVENSESPALSGSSDTNYYSESQVRLIASTGMLLSQVSDMSSRIYGIPRGVTIEQITADGIIDTDGLNKDDIITHINGIRIFTVDDMFSLMQDAVKKNNSVCFKIYRNGATFSTRCECSD